MDWVTPFPLMEQKAWLKCLSEQIPDRSEEGQAIVTLFDRFMSGKRLIIDKTYSIYRYIN
jgi:hypothetical protein